MQAKKTLVVAVHLMTTKGLDAGIVIFTDVNAFRAAAGPLTEIDFTIMPDGSPTPLDTPIELTPEFNYTDWGVAFSSPVPSIGFFASSSGGGSLGATSQMSSIFTWVVADFEPSVYALGFTASEFGPYLSVFDSEGTVFAEARAFNFVGMISDQPIDWARIDEHSDGVAIGSLMFRPVPEPATLVLMMAGAWFVARRRAGGPRFQTQGHDTTLALFQTAALLDDPSASAKQQNRGY